MFCSSFLRVGLEILDGGLGWKLEDSFCFLPILDIVSTRSGDVSVRMLRTLQLNSNAARVNFTDCYVRNLKIESPPIWCYLAELVGSTYETTPPKIRHRDTIY